MTFSQAAKALSLSDFPEEMDLIWEDLEKTGKFPFGRDMIVHLQEEYDLFTDYYEAVLCGFEDLERDEARKVWAYTVAAYALNHTREELKKIPLPETDLTPAGQMAPLFPLLVRAEKSYFEYLRRGFSEKEAREYLTTYRSSMSVTFYKTGKPGLQKTHFDWSGLYAFTEIFEAGGFKFALGQADNTTFVLVHKATGEEKVLLNDVVMHRDGMPLGSAGFEDEDGAYPVSFEETKTHFVGYPVIQNRCTNKAETFSKKEWDLRVKPGDDIFCVHIPKGTDLSPEKVYIAINLAREITKRSYPERAVKGLRCTSWLLSPALGEILGEGSNIARFGALFTRYPFKNKGKGIFNFAFGGKPEKLEDLPETTSLQRKVKAHLLCGGHVLSCGGFIMEGFDKE